MDRSSEEQQQRRRRVGRGAPSSSSEKSFDLEDDSDYTMMKQIKMEPEGGILSQDDDIMAQLQQESLDLEVEPSFSLEESTRNVTAVAGTGTAPVAADTTDDTIDDTTDECNEGVLIQHMDIREPLSTLRNLLEQRLGVELMDYSFWLQDAQMLESHKNLVDQCVQGEGLVQVNVQIKPNQRRINIVDVLKPPEDYAELPESAPPAPQEEATEVKRHYIKWMVDAQYKQEQERLKIPADPKNWSQTHVKHWLQWAVRQFNLVSLRLADWNITGEKLCDLTHKEFQSKVPLDPGEVFWTHLELLRKCKFVAVVQKDPAGSNNSSECTSVGEKTWVKQTPPPPTTTTTAPTHIRIQKSPKTVQTNKAMLNRLIVGGLSSSCVLDNSSITLAASSRTVNSGQIQLWQFLLELLTDREHRDAIRWVGPEGEFKLNQPEAVAQLWGARKNKPSMNYEKLSRALRYYYDGDMISKVHGKRFVYKFVCDLKQLLGYSAAELCRLVEGGRRYF